MKVLWSSNAWESYLYWQHIDARTVEKINALIKDIGRSPFRGIGKPEALKGPLSGWWSRRITDEHRLVHRVVGSPGAQVLEIAQCRYHY